MTLNSADTAFADALRAQLSDDVLREPEPRHLEEPRGRYKGQGGLLALPRDTEEVATLIRAAHQARVPVVPYGGGTGLVGGQISGDGPAPLILSLERLNRIRAVLPEENVLIAEAGVVLADVQAAAEDANRLFPLSLAAEGTARIGGTLATNAGGTGVLRYGNARDLCLGLEAVLPDGQIWNGLTRLRKNNTGYDLRHLFIGAEGTLGFITEATMKLTRKPDDLTVLVLGLNDLTNTMDVLQAFQKKLDLTAYEFFSHQAMGHVLAHGQVQAPFETEAPYYALLEFEAVSDQVMDDAMALFEQCVEEGWVLDGVISQSETQAQNLWQLRERISESIAPRIPYKNDISVVVSKVPGFLQEIDNVVTEHYPDFEIIWFGHIGDGNLHLNILKPEDMAKEDFFEKCQQVNKWVFEIVERYQGSVSAEHGVGMTKKPYLQYTRSEAEIAYLRGIKQVFDPNNIMNPGKIFD